MNCPTTQENDTMNIYLHDFCGFCFKLIIIDRWQLCPPNIKNLTEHDPIFTAPAGLLDSSATVDSKLRIKTQ